jgi:REP element-mobilizing transposase RayT
MPRRAREEHPDAIHHVFARGNNGQRIYFDDADCQVYLVILGGVVRVYEWEVLSYCLMPNHVHLLVETPNANLGAGMQRLHGHYARFFNRRYARSGHLFRKPYGHKRIKDDAQFLAVVSYIAVNPVAAGLCATAELWDRSSHRAIVGTRDETWLNTARLMHHLASRPGEGERAYRACVNAGVAGPPWRWR